MPSSDLLSEAEALSQMLAAVPSPTRTQTLPLAEAWHRRAARAYHATVPLPGFDNSMMDGYALRAIATQQAETLQVVGTQPAGPGVPLRLEHAGQAIRIYTGAPIPEGADAVIMQEDTRRDEDRLLCLDPVEPGENIRRQGSDLCVGQTLLRPGDLLTPGRLALLASQGLPEVEVFPCPRVAVLTTGDELVVPGTTSLQAGQLYNSNATLLQTLLIDQGFTAPTVRHCPDTLEATIAALSELAENHDAIVITGGVSVGDRDFVKPALTALGMPPQLWRIRVKPGKPFLFTQRQVPHPLQVFGLPGNPVSAFVTHQIFVRPALLKLSGAPDSALAAPATPAQLAEAVTNPGDRPHYLRGRLENGQFHPATLQRSDALFALSQANALLRVEAGATLEAGAWISVLPC